MITRMHLIIFFFTTKQISPSPRKHGFNWIIWRWKKTVIFVGGGIGIFNSRVGRRAKTRSWNWLFQLGFGSGTICRKAGTLLLSSQCPVHWFRGFAAWNWGFWILNMFHDVPRVHCWNLNQSWNMFEKNIWCGKLKLMKSQNLPFQIAKKHPAFHSKKL